METAYDWITVAAFAGLVTLFLSRSLDARLEDDRLWSYFVPAAAFGAADWLGNNGKGWAAVAVAFLALGYMLRYLRLPPGPPRH